MARMTTFAQRACGLGMALALAGCGGALEELAAELEQKQAIPVADVGAAPAIAEYCDVTLPDPATSPRDSWTTSSFYHVMKNGVSFMAASVTSAIGHSEDWDDPDWLVVAANDYRNGTGSAGSLAEGERNMGVSFPTLLPARAIACVAQVSKMTYEYQQAAPAQLAWRSFWNPVLPMSTLPGKPVDGFEFVSNFSPASGQVLFRVSKERFASTQGLSICHLAPHQQQWSCALPTAADRGALWQLSQADPRPGVYMLVAQ